MSENPNRKSQPSRPTIYNVQTLVAAITEGITQEETVDFWSEKQIPYRFTLWPLTHAQRAELERMDMQIGQKLMGEGFNEAVAEAMRNGDTDQIRQATLLMEERRRSIDMATIAELGDHKIAQAVAYSIKTIELLWTDSELRRAIKELEEQIARTKSESEKREMVMRRKELMGANEGDTKGTISFTRNAPCPTEVVVNLPHQMPQALYYFVQKLNAYDLPEEDERQLLDVVGRFLPEFVGNAVEELARTRLPSRAESAIPDTDSNVGAGSGDGPGSFPEGTGEAGSVDGAESRPPDSGNVTP